MGALATTLVFTKLVLIHRHYYLMFSPAIALLTAYAVYAIWHRLQRLSPRKAMLALPLSAVLLLLSLLQGLMQIEALTLTPDPYMRQLGKTIAAHTAPDDKLVMINGGWGGDLLILSGRRGVSADNPDILQTREKGRSLQSLGYNKIVIASESPLLHAAQSTNPGSSNKKRVLWESFTTEASTEWEDVYRSEDMVIKKLPRLHLPQ